MSEENEIIRQRFELEDKVTPALDSMLSSIQGTTTAMGALLKSVERFQNAASKGGFNINFDKTADAVRNISDAYKSAAISAQGFVGIAGDVNSIGLNTATATQNAPKPSISSKETKTFATEFEKIKNNLSEVISGIGEKIMPLRNRIASGLDGIGGIVSRKLRPAKIAMSVFGIYVRQRFQQMRESAARRLEPMTRITKRAFSRVKELADKYLTPIANIAGMAFLRLKESLIKDRHSRQKHVKSYLVVLRDGGE